MLSANPALARDAEKKPLHERSDTARPFFAEVGLVYMGLQFIYYGKLCGPQFGLLLPAMVTASTILPMPLFHNAGLLSRRIPFLYNPTLTKIRIFNPGVA